VASQDLIILGAAEYFWRSYILEGLGTMVPQLMETTHSLGDESGHIITVLFIMVSHSLPSLPACQTAGCNIFVLLYFLVFLTIILEVNYRSIYQMDLYHVRIGSADLHHLHSSHWHSKTDGIIFYSPAAGNCLYFYVLLSTDMLSSCDRPSVCLSVSHKSVFNYNS